MPSDPLAVLAEVAAAVPSQSWMLVGGLMVHCHAQRAAVLHQRPTHDADLVVEIQSAAYSDVARALVVLGYELHVSLDVRAPTHRFVRGEHDVVDLMVPDQQPRPVRHLGRDVVEVPGSKSALKRTLVHELPAGPSVRIPDLSAALSLKAAAYFVPAANRERHLQDVVTLLVCAARTGLQPPPSKSMAKNINKVLWELGALEAWQMCPPADRVQAVRAARSLNAEWRAPEFVVPTRPRRTR